MIYIIIILILLIKLNYQKKCIFAPIYLLNFLITSIGIGDILYTIFLDLTDKIKALVYYNILKHDPFLYCKSFAEQYDIPFSPSELSSQRISEIIRNITSKDRLLFYHLWSEIVDDNDYLALDTTSISSYSNLLSKPAYGHNKQNKKLKQINLCYLFGERSGLPVFTTSYNGSLHDVSTLITTVKQTSFLQNRHL
jgi:transposase